MSGAPNRGSLDFSVQPIPFTDGVLTAIDQRLAAVAPERGGALLATGRLVHLLIEDDVASYSGASWDISAQLSAAVGGIEKAGRGTLAGTVHTHPAGISDPSGTDVVTMREALEMNPHLDALIIAVVTKGTPREYDMPVGERHRMSVHLLRRSGSPDPVPVRVRAIMVPLTGDLVQAGLRMGSATDVSTQHRTQSGISNNAGLESLPRAVTVSGRARLAVPVPADRPAALFIDPDYPVVGPLAVTAKRDAGAPAALVAVSSPWDPVSPAGSQLAALARVAAGSRVKEATERVWPLVGSLADRRVLLAGAGSVGSRIADDLVRCGVGSLIVIDPDGVEPSNLARTTYIAADIGTPKPDALGRRLSAIDPAVVVEGHAARLGSLDLATMVKQVDLVVAATDDMAEQALLAHHAYAAGTPLVACALYRQAAAGEVVISVPAAGTPCWSCSVGGASTGIYRPDPDYGLGGRLAGEAALGPSIHLVASVASSIAVGLLAGPDSTAGAPLRRLFARRLTLGLVATAPAWEFFPQVFASMEANQHAPQSIFVRVLGAEDCPVCGPNRIAPLSRQAGEQLAAIINAVRHPSSEGNLAAP
jgi:molybdopterin/thiamine biosynthesis adenylyltransferase